MNTTIVQKVKHIVEQASKEKTNFYGIWAWDPHTKSVVHFAKMLAKKTGADEYIVTLAALLHDYAAIKDTVYIEDHHIHGARLAKEVLDSLGVDGKIIDHVALCILNHRGSKPRKRTTREEQCVADADAIAHFANLTSLFNLALVVRKLPPEDAREFVVQKLQRSYKKLCPEAQKIMRVYFDASQLLLQKNDFK